MTKTDYGTIQPIIDMASGVILTLLTGYGGMKYQKKVIFPTAKIENGRAKIASLTEKSQMYDELKGVVGNVTKEELADIIKSAEEYLYTDGGISVLEAQKLGLKICRAVQNK